MPKPTCSRFKTDDKIQKGSSIETTEKDLIHPSTDSAPLLTLHTLGHLLPQWDTYSPSWDLDHKTTSGGLVIFDMDVTLVIGDDSIDNGQSQARSPLAG